MTPSGKTGSEIEVGSGVAVGAGAEVGVATACVGCASVGGATGASSEPQPRMTVKSASEASALTARIDEGCIDKNMAA